MDKNPSRVSRLDPTIEVSSSTVKLKNRHYPVDDGGDDNQHVHIKCSGKHCSSCTATLVADCIAVCCCPCAIVNVLVLAFVKVPWMMGRRCLGLVKKKRRRLERKSSTTTTTTTTTTKENKDAGVIIERRRRGRERDHEEVVVVEDIKLEFPGGVPLVVDRGFEAEKVWLELYDQVGGVSFYGNQGKS